MSPPAVQAAAAAAGRRSQGLLVQSPRLGIVAVAVVCTLGLLPLLSRPVSALQTSQSTHGKWKTVASAFTYNALARPAGVIPSQSGTFGGIVGLHQSGYVASCNGGNVAPANVWDACTCCSHTAFSPGDWAASFELLRKPAAAGSFQYDLEAANWNQVSPGCSYPQTRDGPIICLKKLIFASDDEIAATQYQASHNSAVSDNEGSHTIMLMVLDCDYGAAPGGGCLQCNLGQYALGDACDDCPAGTYADSAAKNVGECTACPAGRTSPVGATSRAQCTATGVAARANIAEWVQLLTSVQLSSTAILTNGWTAPVGDYQGVRFEAVSGAVTSCNTQSPPSASHPWESCAFQVTTASTHDFPSPVELIKKPAETSTPEYIVEAPSMHEMSPFCEHPDLPTDDIVCSAPFSIAPGDEIWPTTSLASHLATTDSAGTLTVNVYGLKCVFGRDTQGGCLECGADEAPRGDGTCMACNEPNLTEEASCEPVAKICSPVEVSVGGECARCPSGQVKANTTACGAPASPSTLLLLESQQAAVTFGDENDASAPSIWSGQGEYLATNVPLHVQGVDVAEVLVGLWNSVGALSTSMDAVLLRLDALEAA